MLVELQKYEHQSIPSHKAYYDILKPEIMNKVKEIKQNSSKISVRDNMQYVDKYCDDDRWNAISILECKEIQLHLSRLVDNDINQAKGSLSFDLKMLMAELSMLAQGNVAKAGRQVNQVRIISRVLLDNASILAIIEKSDILKTLVSSEFWENPSIEDLEKYRKEVRDLVQYLPPKEESVIIDTGDGVISGEYDGKVLIDVRTYRGKVIDYLSKHTNNETIKKIQNLQPIDSDDMKKLERILWNELGSKKDYEESTSIDNLAVFIRSIVGIEQESINEKFGEFLSGNILNSQQQEFVKQSIDYVRENGDIQAEDLLDKSPFDSEDIITLFGPQVTVIRNIIDVMHNSIIAT